MAGLCKRDVSMFCDCRIDELIDVGILGTLWTSVNLVVAGVISLLITHVTHTAGAFTRHTTYVTHNAEQALLSN